MEVLKKFAVDLLELPVHDPKFIALLKQHNLLLGNTQSILMMQRTSKEGAVYLISNIERSLTITRTSYDKLLLVMKQYKDDGMEELANQMETASGIWFLNY